MEKISIEPVAYIYVDEEEVKLRDIGVSGFEFQ